MSLSAITSLTVIDSPLYTSTASTAAATAVAKAAASADSTSLTILKKDLADLIKALATGDLSTAKALLAQLQKSLKAQAASKSASATAASTAASKAATISTSSPLEQLLSAISDALNAGSTSDALYSLASYLTQSGNANGNLIDTLA